jgi:invasion protein IalB
MNNFRFFCKFAITLTLSGILSGYSMAQDVAKKPQDKVEKAAWQVSCNPTDNPNVLSCQMMQNLTLAKTGQRLLAVVIRPQPKHQKKEPAILLTLPHGLYLPAGVKLQIDDAKPINLAIRTSDKNGTYTAMSLNIDLVGALKKGNTLKVTMTANND